MRGFNLLVIVCLLITTTIALAGPGDSPKATLVEWTRNIGEWDLEQTLKIYAFTGTKEADFARALAGQALAQTRLQKLVRGRWGVKAELAVARAITDDTLEDDLAATEKIDGNHATLTFKDEAHLPPLLLVKVERQWKIDVAAYLRDLGDDAEGPTQFLSQTTAIVQAGIDGVKSGRFKDNEALVDYLKVKYDQIRAGQ